MAAASGPFPILGTMTFGVEGQVKLGDAIGILKAFSQQACAASPGGIMVDTARIYQQSTPDGDTETILGQVFAAESEVNGKVSIHTKANAMTKPYTLSKQSVIEQCNISLKKLGLESIPIYYLHIPDIETDINDTLTGIDELHTQGKIKEFGLSNYPAWAVVDIWYRCKNKGMVLPTVYQGMYNIITRDFERELVPVAREFGLRLYMYNPMAGGLLSGRYRTMEDMANATEGRFSEEFNKAFGSHIKAGEIYRARYSKTAIFDGLTILREACHAVGLGMAEVALRWVAHHSLLSACDGVILGVSRLAQLEANMRAWQAGPLPTQVVEACDAAWEASRPACEAYFRGYGAKPGGIEKFLARKEQQAEKTAKKARTEA